MNFKIEINHSFLTLFKKVAVKVKIVSKIVIYSFIVFWLLLFRGTTLTILMMMGIINRSQTEVAFVFNGPQAPSQHIKEEQKQKRVPSRPSKN
jgi:hypothetical protein